MTKNFEELDFRSTPLGDLMLRRRRLHSLGGIDVFEVKLGDDFLMSSLFHKVEVALAHLGLGELRGEPLDVLVGGLGLGYTAVAALEHETLRSLIVIEALKPVIDWHVRGLVPLGPEITADARCRLINGDFFALADSVAGFDPDHEGRRFDAILLDIDHSPRDLLHPRNADFYQPAGLRAFARHIRSDGVFAMWSDDPPDDDFMAMLDSAFTDVRAHVVTFANPLLESDSASTVYVARKPPEIAQGVSGDSAG
ncbi:MAG: spermidine synthase [Verrucomicrobiota bacterium]|nr:spermidine synthase [Verrucomicrobiota bacterium]